MASQNKKDEGGGCLAVFIVLAIVVTALFWVGSLLGHAIGLTPTFSEATNSSEGWVGRHYEGVVVGYVLTVAFVGAVLGLLWTAVLSQSEDENVAAKGRAW